MKIGQMFPSEYLRGIDVYAPGILTIVAVVEENAMNRETNKVEPEFVMRFKETDKKLRLNITMAKECMLIAGDKQGDSDNWLGKQVTVYQTEVKAFGKEHIVPRLRAVKSGDEPFGGKPAKQTAPAPAFATIDDLLFALSKKPVGLKEGEAKAALKALKYETFKASASQEMYDSVVVYMEQQRPTDEEKRATIEDVDPEQEPLPPVDEQDELPF